MIIIPFTGLVWSNTYNKWKSIKTFNRKTVLFIVEFSFPFEENNAHAVPDVILKISYLLPDADAGGWVVLVHFSPNYREQLSEHNMPLIAFVWVTAYCCKTCECLCIICVNTFSMSESHFLFPFNFRLESRTTPSSLPARTTDLVCTFGCFS